MFYIIKEQIRKRWRLQSHSNKKIFVLPSDSSGWYSNWYINLTAQEQMIFEPVIRCEHSRRDEHLLGEQLLLAPEQRSTKSHTQLHRVYFGTSFADVKLNLEETSHRQDSCCLQLMATVRWSGHQQSQQCHVALSALTNVTAPLLMQTGVRL